MILAQLPTGITMALILVIALSIGAFILAIVLAFARATSKTPELEEFRRKIQSMTESELEEDNINRNIVNPKSWTGYWYRLVKNTGRVPTSIEKPSQLVLVMIVLSAAIGLLVFPRGIFGLIALPVCIVFLFRAIIKSEATKREKTLHKQLPQLIAALESNLASGGTIENSMKEIAKDLPAPLGDELIIVRNELEVGSNFNETLDRLADRVPSKDMQFLVSAIKIANTSGQDLIPQLAIIREIIDSRTRLNQKLATAVAGVTPALWVAGIAIPGLFLFRWFSDPSTQAFWFTFIGIVCFVIVIALYLGSMWFTKHMIKGVEKA